MAKFVDIIQYKQRPKQPVSMDMFKLDCISNGVTSFHRFILTKNNNQLYGTGSNIHFQLGINETFRREKYFRFTEIEYFTENNIKLKQIDSGHSFSTFLTETGDIVKGNSGGPAWFKNDHTIYAVVSHEISIQIVDQPDIPPIHVANGFCRITKPKYDAMCTYIQQFAQTANWC